MRGSPPQEQGIRLFTCHVRRGAADVQDPSWNSHSKLNCIAACIQVLALSRLQGLGTRASRKALLYRGASQGVGREYGGPKGQQSGWHASRMLQSTNRS